MKKSVMIMVDGFGIPPEGWGNSIYSRYGTPAFAETLSTSIPLDARMGVPGTPQSATGQTALFTGMNAAKAVGGHRQGFPGPELRAIIRKRNLFSELIANGSSVVFANAYATRTYESLAESRMRSVTTIMTHSAGLRFKTRADLVSGEAVYHDLTRATLSEPLEMETITPETAALHLAEIAERHDFTLFEYFLTDRAGHKRAAPSAVLAEFAAFFTRALELAGDELAVLLTSDHGNLESPETRGHTANPVPLFVHGYPQELTANANSITDVFDIITKFHACA